MDFLAPELIRAIGYSVIIPSFVVIANRAWRANNYDMAILAAALALNYTWLFVDLTLIASGQSTRELRGISTPLVVLVAVTAGALAFHPVIAAWNERRRQKPPTNGPHSVSYRH